MTNGKKISVLRKKLKLTQTDLAKNIDVHIASIKKYEADKMNPKKEHLEKIADILKVNPYVISQNEYNIQLNTVGDLYTVVFELYNANVIDIKVNSNGAFITINPMLYSLVELEVNPEKTVHPVQLISSFSEKIKTTSKYDLFIKWATETNDLKSFINSLSNNENPVAVKTINEFKEKIELLELDLQQSPELLSDL